MNWKKMNKIEKLNNFISESPQGTIFTTPEWLEAVAPGKWQYLTVESGDSIKICMPIILSKKIGVYTMQYASLHPIFRNIIPSRRR